DQGNQFLGILPIGGIARFAKAVRPFFVIVPPVVEQKGIARTGRQEQTVVAEGIHRMVVLSETFALGVIIVKIKFALPARMALNPKMVVGLQGKLAPPGTTFQNALRQGDAGRNAIGPHFVLGDLGKGLDIFLRIGNRKSLETSRILRHGVEARILGTFVLVSRNTVFALRLADDGSTLSVGSPSFFGAAAREEQRDQDDISNSFDHTFNKGKFFFSNTRFMPFIPCKPPVWMAKIWVFLGKTSSFTRSKIPKSIFPV